MLVTSPCLVLDNADKVKANLMIVRILVLHEMVGGLDDTFDLPPLQKVLGQPIIGRTAAFYLYRDNRIAVAHDEIDLIFPKGVVER